MLAHSWGNVSQERLEIFITGVLWLFAMKWLFKKNTKMSESKKPAMSHLVRTWCPTCQCHNMDVKYKTEELAQMSAKILSNEGWPSVVVPVPQEKNEEPKPVDPNDLTDEEFISLSFYHPNLSCVIEREPPRAIEETRRGARQELAEILRELKKYREMSNKVSR